MRGLKRLVADESGATAIEYGLLTAALALGIVLILDSIGVSLRDDVFSVLADAIRTPEPTD